MNYNLNNLNFNNFNNFNINNFNINNELSLNDLKNILYSNKNLSDKDKIGIKKLINKKINLTKTKIIKSETESEMESETESEIESVESKDILIENDDINKLFDRVDKKGQNQRFTQSSKKLLDRMFSEASYINNYQIINNTNVMTKPYIDDNNNDNKKKLGIRKNIIK